MDPIQEIHLDRMLGDGVLEAVEYPAPVAQGHVLLVQLEKQKQCRITTPTKGTM